MRQNHVKRLLQSGQPAVGTYMGLPSPQAAEYMAQIGFDWIVVDTEHYPIDITTASLMFTTMARTRTAPMARIPWNSPENIKRVLDAGAWGIIFPMVQSRDEAEMIVSACKYPPEGTRSVGGGRHSISFDTEAGDYQKNANNEICVVLQIESVTGVERCDEILSVPGVDACFIGPNDLAASMHLPTAMESDDPRIVEAIAHIRDTARRLNVAPGIHTSGPPAANRRIEEGFQFVAVASELRFMLGGAREAVNSVKALADRLAQPAGESVRY